MKRFISLLFLITIFTQFDLVGQTSKKTATRTIKFIDLREGANAPFWGYNREIPRLIMAAIENGSIKSFRIDYDKKYNLKPLSVSEYKKTLEFSQDASIPEDQLYYQGVDYLFASDFPYIGLDQTISIVDGKECVHVHYIHFYNHESFSEDQKTRQYRFSVTWEDFIAILKQRTNLLYTPNIYGAWWRGNVFITNERYFIESKTSDFIELSRAYAILPKDFHNFNVLKTVDSLGKKNYEPSMMDLYFIEEKKESYWNIKRLFFGTVPQDQSYLNERRFGYEWKDFVSVLGNKKNAASSNIYTLANAFALKTFSYSDTIESIQISKNGKFKNGKKDVLCSVALSESFSNNASPVTNTTFHTQLLESLYLGDTSNTHLNIEGHGLAEILYDYVLSGTLTAYEYDSLHTPITVNTFKSNASQYLDVPEIMYGIIYKNGDTVSMNVHVGDYWNYETRYFIVQETFNGSDFVNDSSYMSKLKRYYPPLIPVEELNVVEFMQHVSFDQEGNNKKYKLEVVALHVSADGPSNIKGIQYPVCYVRWQDLKSVLLKDARASFVYKGRQVNLIDIIENREFLSIFLKTGFLEVGE
jgi:hypothetical protein